MWPSESGCFHWQIYGKVVSVVAIVSFSVVLTAQQMTHLVLPFTDEKSFGVILNRGRRGVCVDMSFQLSWVNIPRGFIWVGQNIHSGCGKPRTNSLPNPIIFSSSLCFSLCSFCWSLIKFTDFLLSLLTSPLKASTVVSFLWFVFQWVDSYTYHLSADLTPQILQAVLLSS